MQTEDSIGDDEVNSDMSPIGHVIVVQEAGRLKALISATPPALVAILMLTSVIGTAILVRGPLMSLFGPDDYILIGYDDGRTRGFAEGLTSIGPRLSGSIGEEIAVQMILENMTAAGLQEVHQETFAVPMFAIMNEPELSLCRPGDFSLPINRCTGSDFGREITDFTHKIDFVLQGYSGSREIAFNERIPIIDLEDGSDDNLWEDAQNGIGVLSGATGVGSNTVNFQRAIDEELQALILVNTNVNCGQVETDDCVPFFKSVGVSDLTLIPDDIAFMMVSNNTGTEILDSASEGGFLSMNIQVDNGGTREVRVPCGVIQGSGDEQIIIGAHHDTVYNGPGAIDDTSGTSSVLEIAHQLSSLTGELGMPQRTLKFCTWGGEEEGLWGSRAWVEKHSEELLSSLRLYINLDMNHVDIDLAARGNQISLFGNDQRDIDAIKEITEMYQQERAAIASKYNISIQLLSNDKNADGSMPYNSDHGPFVYDISDDYNGRALVCYGSGSWEYHTYKDDMSRFNEESLGVSSVIYGTYARHLAWNGGE